jgi:integrase
MVGPVVGPNVMARNLLSDLKVKALAEPGRYADGDGLYLAVGQAGRKRWVFLYRDGKRRIEMGLGSPGEGVTLKLAREAAEEARVQRRSGFDPLDERKRKERVRQQQREVPTFGNAQADYIAINRGSWRNEKHAWQWEQTLGVGAKALHAIKVNEIDTAAVKQVLDPLFRKTPETARRTRARIEAVLSKARADHESLFPPNWSNPARWRGHLDHAYRKQGKRLQRGHHPALPYADIPVFMTELRMRTALSARALEFTILTAARTGEALGATWGELDLEAAIWTVPGSRMKMGDQHKVPLAPATVTMLRSLPRTKGVSLVFSAPDGRRFSGMAMLMLLRRMGRGDLSVHGFRSSFRDWAAETTGFDHATCEAALAHKVTNSVEAAYRRGDMLAKRRKLMDAWAGYCERKAANVVRLERRA